MTSVPSISIDEFDVVGAGVTRPEGVAVAPDGSVWSADSGSAAARVDAGVPQPVGRAGGEPNGINFLADGRLLISNFQGVLQVLDVTTGEVVPYLEEVDGMALIHTNYALADASGFVWGTDSTRTAEPSVESLPEMLADPNGFLFVRRPDGSAEILAGGLSFANGLCLSPDGRHLYVVETFTGTIKGAEILRGGGIGPLTEYYVFAPDGYEAASKGVPGYGESDHELDVPGPDGIGMDEDGNLWVTLYNRHALAVVTPDRQMTIAAAEPDVKVLGYPTNVAWGGADRRTLYVGSVALPHVARTRVTTPGARQPYEIVTPAAGR